MKTSYTIEQEVREINKAISDIKDLIMSGMNDIKATNQILDKSKLGKRIKTKIKRAFFTISREKKQYCRGCYNNIYNGGMAKECWSLSSAKICKKKQIHINDVPPWETQPIITTLSCYRVPKYVFVKPSQKY